MLRRFVKLVVSGCILLLSSSALAGPVEQLDAVAVNPADASHLVVPYRYGGGGMFVSRDGGKSFGWLCSAGVASSAINRIGRTLVGGDGSIYLTQFDGLLRGDAAGCGFARVPELEKKYIADLAADPIDPKRTYAITTNPMVENGLFVNDGSGTFTPFGTTTMQFLDAIKVVKSGAGRRFYITSVQTDVQTNEVKYFVRVSDDQAMTWSEDFYDLAQFGPMDKYADFTVVAVNPTNPDEIVGRVWRKDAVDTLVISAQKGKAGSWQLLAEPTEADAVMYTPEGALYFGDSDQTTRALFVVDAPGAAPRMLNNTWRVLCLGYDEPNKSIFGCSNYYLFGHVDAATGVLTPTLDLRCTQKFVECPGQTPMMNVCEPQALAEFCSLSHWVLAPVCDVYDRGPDLAMYQESQTIMCVDGLGVSKPDGTTSAAAGSGVAGMPATSRASGVMASACGGATAAGGCATPSNGNAGNAASVAGASAAPAQVKSSGCSTLGPEHRTRAAGAAVWLALLGMLASRLIARRRLRSIVVPS